MGVAERRGEPALAVHRHAAGDGDGQPAVRGAGVQTAATASSSRYTYRFFEANLLVFFALLLVTGAAQQIWVGRVFFIWTSVFNLFVVSVFWAFMVDVFSREQGKRLFGFIAAGATVGAMSGSSSPRSLGRCSGRRRCCWCRWCCWRSRSSRCGGCRASPRRCRRRRRRGTRRSSPIGGGMMAGLSRARQQPLPAQREPVHAALHDHRHGAVFPAGRHRRPLVHRPRRPDGVLRTHRPRRQRADAGHAVVPHEPHPRARSASR